jgi:hypothetical protein
MRAELGLRWRPPSGGMTEALGTPLSPALVTELEAIDLVATPPRADLITIVGAGAERTWLPHAHRVTVADDSPWNSDAALNAATVPMRIVSAIVARIEETIP